ncbi:MAG TPA: TolC family protein [Gemmatimonadaceae bacterium]|jgi:outer membrane protein TolC
MRISSLVLIALAFATPLVAQQPLTLEEAIQMAQKQGPSAQMARSSRDAARARNDAFNSGLLPQVSLGATAADLTHGIAPILQNDGTLNYINVSQNTSSAGLTVAQKIPLTGGTLSVGSSVTRFDDFAGGAAHQYTTTPFFVQLDQDLFKPRNLVWDEKVQSLNAGVAERAYLEAREDVAGNIAGAYFDLYAADVSWRNATANVAVNDTLYTLNKGRYEVGKIGENDLLKSELQLLRARASAEDAKVQRDRSDAALRRQLVYPDGREMTIVPPNTLPAIDADPDVAVHQALRNASVIEQGSLDETQGKRATTTARLNNRFNATLSATVGFNQKGDIFSRAYNSPQGRQTATLGVSMPMLQWGAGASQVEAARADEQRIAANNKSRRDALAEDARFSVVQLRQAQRNVAIAAKADTVSAKQFEVARNRYTIGKISNTDLYNAQNDKDQAVIAYVQALRTYWTAYYHLRRATLYDFATKSALVDDRER